MTESEWQTSTNPDLMLRYFGGKTSHRKLRLFSCACAVQYGNLVPGEDYRRLVKLAEEFSDESISAEVFISEATKEDERLWGVHDFVTNPLEHAIDEATVFAALARHSGTSRQEARFVTCELLRDIVGNPFRPAVLYESWLTWNNGIIFELANGIYEERAFDRLPILGDALVDAGCRCNDIVGHCYLPGPHVRGCWVVDLMTGRA